MHIITDDPSYKQMFEEKYSMHHATKKGRVTFGAPHKEASDPGASWEHTRMCQRMTSHADFMLDVCIMLLADEFAGTKGSTVFHYVVNMHQKFRGPYVTAPVELGQNLTSSVHLTADARELVVPKLGEALLRHARPAIKSTKVHPLQRAVFKGLITQDLNRIHDMMVIDSSKPPHLGCVDGAAFMPQLVAEFPKIKAIQEGFKKHRQHGGRHQGFWKTLLEEVLNEHLRKCGVEGEWGPTQTPGRYTWRPTEPQEIIAPSQAPVPAPTEAPAPAKAVFVPRMFPGAGTGLACTTAKHAVRPPTSAKATTTLLLLRESAAASLGRGGITPPKFTEAAAGRGSASSSSGPWPKPTHELPPPPWKRPRHE